MRAIREIRFRVMGSAAHVVVVGGAPGAAHAARRRLDDLERRWSRFIPTSELSRLNAAGGAHCIMSADSVRLVQLSVHGWWATGGLFDPTVLAAVVSAGYDRSFEYLDDPGVPSGPALPAPGCGGITADIRSRLVRLPQGVTLDPGGIGKGLAADIVAEEQLAAGADGVCVNVGGDVRVAGEAPSASGWIVGVEDPRRPDHDLVRVALADGAVATSSTLLRRWQRCGSVVHHLVDPSTGAPAAHPAEVASVIAGEAWWAEVVAKAALLRGETAAISQAGSEGLIVDAEGAYAETPGLHRLRALLADAPVAS
jgi:thiamine biosynthesis lipoprotein